jgi:imidazoleglycerol-phosphate dehydratase
LGDYHPPGSTLRKSKNKRVTKETHVEVEVSIDGAGRAEVKTGLSFIDHLIVALAKHSMMDINLKAVSNDGILHHLVEDIATTLSQSIDKALLQRSQVTRFGYATVPMDEALAHVALDLVKRQFHNIRLKLTTGAVEGIPSEEVEHFMRSLVQNLNACTHIMVEYGDNDHHKIESTIKAFALAFRMAASIDNRQDEGVVPSTKGAM